MRPAKPAFDSKASSEVTLRNLIRPLNKGLRKVGMFVDLAWSSIGTN
jgi:hypothetical protein